MSNETLALIDRLYEPAGSLRWPLGPREDRAALIGRIGLAGEPAAIFYLLPFVLEESAIAEAAALAIHQLLEPVPPLGLVQLDRWAREMGPHWHDLPLPWGRWGRLSPMDLPRLGRLPGGWAVLAAATFHRSGFVREAALQRLAATPLGRALPLVLLRVNDWVDPVRRVAETALERFARSPDPEALVASLHLLLHMLTWRRRHFQPLVQSLLQLLQQPGARPALARGLEAGDRYIRRECFRLALSAPGLDAAEAARLIERGLADADILVRLGAARCLRTLDDPSLRRLGAAARADPFMPVRREAVDACAARFPAEAAPILRDALLDRHASIREFARYRLGKQPGGFDLAAFYRGAIHTRQGDALRAAILGLAETGSAADAPLVLPFCSHPRVKVREAAVWALPRLDAENSIDAILRALADPSPRVSKQARMVLEEHRDFSVHDWVWEVARQTNHPVHARLNALHVLATLPRWIRLPFILRAVGATDAEIAAPAHEYLDAWLATGGGFRKPTLAQVREIQEALKAAAGTLEPADRDAIREEIAHWLRY